MNDSEKTMRPEEEVPAADAAPPGGESGEGDADPARVVEADLDEAISAVEKERDDYLDALRRLQADFENYKKRMTRQQTELLERAGQDLVERLLPVLDAVDLARQHDAGEGVEQIASALTEALSREGLERIDGVGDPFDPNEHEAVAHQPTEEGDDGQVVAAVMRAGYRWKGRLLRPAMVAVRG
ncbi:MAG TPA: nucleotide exchange factor GrpE [Acidimicrobiales bacterium]|nr:nucleotide exchange factor GrpE [Acidimicrobiales bacterium]